MHRLSLNGDDGDENNIDDDYDDDGVKTEHR